MCSKANQALSGGFACTATTALSAVPCATAHTVARPLQRAPNVQRARICFAPPQAALSSTLHPLTADAQLQVPAHRRVRASALHGRNQWPENRPTFTQALQQYVHHMGRLGSAIMRGIARGLQLPPEWFEQQFQGDPYWVVRVIHYPPLPGHDRDAGSEAPAAARALAGAELVCSCMCIQQEMADVLRCDARHLRSSFHATACACSSTTLPCT